MANQAHGELVSVGMEKVARSGRQLLRVMEDMPLFATMHERERAELGELADIVRCPGGTVVYEDKQKGEYVYFIIQGNMEFRTRVGPGMVHTLRDFRDEGIVGLDVALGAEKHHMQCYARDKTAALRFRTSDIKRILEAARPSAVKLFTVMGIELGRQIRMATNDAVYMLEKTSMMPQTRKTEGEDGAVAGILDA